MVWQYDGCATDSFFGEMRGEQQVLENGNVLTYEPQGGWALEVTHDPNPQIVWNTSTCSIWTTAANGLA